MVDFMTELAADNLLPLRQAVPPPEALAAPEPEPPDPRTLRARFYEGVGLTVLDGTIRLSTAVDATSGLVAELRVPAAERPWTVSIDETENTPGPGFRWRELIINGNALGRYVKATGTYALHEATQPARPDTRVEIFVVPAGANDPHSRARRGAADALNGLVFADRDGDKGIEEPFAYGQYCKNDVRFLAVTHSKGDRRNPPQSDLTSALRMIGPTHYRDRLGRKRARVPHSVRMLRKFGVDPETALRNTRFPDGTGLPENLDDFYANAWDIVLTSRDEHASRDHSLDHITQMALYRAALGYIRRYAQEHGITDTQYILGVMDVHNIYRSLHDNGRGDQDWVEAAGVRRRTVMSRKPGSNSSTFAIGRVSSGDPQNDAHWEAHLRQKRLRWHNRFFGSDLEDNHHVAITGMDAPVAEPLWKRLKAVQMIAATWKGAKADLQTVAQEKGRVRAALLAGQLAVTTAVTVPYLFGGLESSVGTASAEVLKHGGNIVEVALAGGLTSTAAELTLTVLLAGCLKYFKQAAAALEKQKYEKPEYSKAGTAALALATGSPGIMLRSAVHTPEASHALAGVKTAAVLFPVNTVASGLVVGGALSFAPEWAVEAAVNPLTWLGLVALYKGIPYAVKSAKESLARRRAAREERFRTPPVPWPVRRNI